MEGQQQDVLALAQLQQGQAQQGSRAQVEGAARDHGREAADLRFRVRQNREIHL
jgi:hypothetical protein